MFGRQILDAPKFEERCINALPLPPKAGSTLWSNPVLTGIDLYSLRLVVYPTPNLCRLNYRLLEIIACGYLDRPMSQRAGDEVVYMLSTRSPEDVRKILKAAKVGNSPSLLTMGTSGMGKTFGVEFSLDQLPQVRRHSVYQGRTLNQLQVVWLYVKSSPPTATLKGLLLDILLQLDLVVGSQHYLNWLFSRASTDVLLINVALILHNHAVGCLVLDELQHLRVQGFKETESLLNFFVALMNFLHIPIVCIGTYAALDVFSGTLRDARRLSTAGNIDFCRYESTEKITRALQDYYLQYLPGLEKRPLTPEFHALIYDIWQGLHFLLPNLVQRCAVEAAYRGEDHVTDEVLKYYREVELKPISKALEALRSKNSTLIERFDDLMSPDAIRALYAHQKRLNDARQAPAAPGLDSTCTEIGRLFTSVAEFPHEDITDAEIAQQCAVTKLRFGNGDAYPTLKENSLIASQIAYGELMPTAK
jgi:hypothetical protein